MIRVDKGSPPRNLAKRAKTGHDLFAAEYLASPRAYRSGAKAFKPDTAIYGSQAVKKRLKAAFHRKCCYCEEFLPPRIAHGHVEHYRPVAFSCQDSVSTPTRPGYYWLAYEWDNLLWSCHYCNSTKKGNQFPLLDPATCVRRHGRSLGRQQPMLIKPDTEDPSVHLDWHKELPVWRDDRGRVTIEVLGLDSPAHETRLSHYRRLEQALAIVNDCTTSTDPRARRHAQSFREFLVRSSDPDQPFSAMASAFLRDNPLPPDPV